MKSNLKQTKIYIYFLEKNNNVFYVGKTKNPKRREYDWKREFGEDINFNLVDETENDKKIWKFWENYWIQQFKQWGFNLVNQNEGGGGLDKHSDKTIEKIKSKKIGIKQNRTKIRKDKGLKHIQSGIKIGRPKGFKYSEELKLHLSNKMKGRSKHSEEGKYKFVDNNVYSFINISTNEEFEGIRYDFQNKYGLRYKGIYNLITNKAKTYKGWKIQLN